MWGNSKTLESGQFKQSHVSALMAMCFEPMFTLNSIYHNIARLVNRTIIHGSDEKIHMKDSIQRKHFPKLVKLAELYFLIQHIKVPRYVLVTDTGLRDMRNTLVAFSDGLENFFTSCIYLISENTQTHKSKTTLLTTLSKIAGTTKDVSLLRTILLKESHGTFLAASSLVKIAKLMDELQLPIHSIYLGVMH